MNTIVINWWQRQITARKRKEKGKKTTNNEPKEKENKNNCFEWRCQKYNIYFGILINSLATESHLAANIAIENETPKPKILHCI